MHCFLSVCLVGNILLMWMLEYSHENLSSIGWKPGSCCTFVRLNRYVELCKRERLLTTKSQQVESESMSEVESWKPWVLVSSTTTLTATLLLGMFYFCKLITLPCFSCLLVQRSGIVQNAWLYCHHPTDLIEERSVKWMNTVGVVAPFNHKMKLSTLNENRVKSSFLPSSGTVMNC
jgi:hypothetical protein